MGLDSVEIILTVEEADPNAVFDPLHDIICRQLGVQADVVTPAARFVKDLGVDQGGKSVKVLRRWRGSPCIILPMQANQL